MNTGSLESTTYTVGTGIETVVGEYGTYPGLKTHVVETCRKQQ